MQVQDAVQLILDTQPQGGVLAGGQSREEVVDSICEDLLSKIPSLFEGWCWDAKSLLAHSGLDDRSFWQYACVIKSANLPACLPASRRGDQGASKEASGRADHAPHHPLAPGIKQTVAGAAACACFGEARQWRSAKLAL
jgi:hypothetical protein